MRYVVLLLLLVVGCAGPSQPLGDLLTPDEFHVFYTDGQSSGSSLSGGSNAPWRRFSDSGGNSTAWTVGLTWSLAEPSGARGLREAVRAMQISARLLADAATASRSASKPSALAEVSEATSVSQAAPESVQIIVETSASVTAPAVIEKPSGEFLSAGEAGSEKPTGVMLLGISSEVWTQLLVAMGLLATAVAGYLGRNKIPGVKRMTKSGRAAKAELGSPNGQGES